ncbi:MAG: phosphoglycolate phosphatase [Azonexus sp.]|jgi:phosphoglycolate phosphatase|nr:phosphoglycolate phosphatase [Azonexus sp.]
MLAAILFDLDGTLADTAPDLGQAANALLREEGLAAKPLAELRPHTSNGARGLLHAAFGITPESPGYEQRLRRFLDHYAARLCVDSRLFPGIPELLDQIEARQLPWGIVTNKYRRFTDPLAIQLGLSPRTPCIVSGDTTAAAKPSPLPLLHACQRLGCQPQQTLYIGDDRRDIIAGKAAGCPTIAVTWGYLGSGGPISDWGADWIIDRPDQLADFLTT